MNKKICILYKGSFSKDQLNLIYLNHLQLPSYTVDTLKVSYPPKGKPKKVEQLDWINAHKNMLIEYDYILVAEAEYFKTLANTRKADSELGVVHVYENIPVLYLPPVSSYVLNPETQKEKILTALNAVVAHSITGTAGIPSIIQSEHYPNSLNDIRNSLTALKQYNALTVDIEAFSLKVVHAGIATIAFAWDKHNFIAIPVDLHKDAKEIRQLLKDFFETYAGKLIVHKANYDVSVLVYNLFMDQDITNIKGKLHGLNKFFCNLEDTLLITYLATNACSGNVLGLKDLAQPFAGKWAVDVSDVTKVPLEDLLRYNGIDCLSTWYVYEKYHEKMVKDDQETVYLEHFKPYLKDKIRMQLTGLPIDLNLVKKLKDDLQIEQSNLLDQLMSSKEIKEAEHIIAENATQVRNSKLKTKVTTLDDNRVPFNFNSTLHLTTLLYNVMALPVIEVTKGNAPATDKQTLIKLYNYTENQHYKDIIKWLEELGDIRKVVSDFIPAFEDAHVDKYGNAHLLGYFNLGGTVSGRNSSSNINLQNLPSTRSRLAKPVKKLFTSNKEWLFVGIDFASLEDRISALLTKDKAKLQVYTDGYDGHCLRAYYYYKDRMPDITEALNNATDAERVNIINSIEKKYPDLRQKSKSPTFALTYQGSPLTLVKQLGFSKEEAQTIYDNFHELYKTSDEYINSRIQTAYKNGYVTAAFGLKIRTHVLGNSLYKAMPNNLIMKEERTAGNALGQSWGLLNDRAMNATLKRIDALGLSDSIVPVATIHDACYYLVRNDSYCLKVLNDIVVEESKWQEAEEIQHDEVGLEGALSVYYPNWATELKLPHNISIEDLEMLCENHRKSIQGESKNEN